MTQSFSTSTAPVDIGCTLRGYLSIYQRSVQPMSTGAVLVEND